MLDIPKGRPPPPPPHAILRMLPTNCCRACSPPARCFAVKRWRLQCDSSGLGFIEKDLFFALLRQLQVLSLYQVDDWGGGGGGGGGVGDNNVPHHNTTDANSLTPSLPRPSYRKPVMARGAARALQMLILPLPCLPLSLRRGGRSRWFRRGISSPLCWTCSWCATCRECDDDDTSAGLLNKVLVLIVMLMEQHVWYCKRHRWHRW